MFCLAIALAVAQPKSAAPIVIKPLKVVAGVRPLAYAAAPTGARIVATLEDGSVRIIDGGTGAKLLELPKHPQPAYAAAWSPDGALIATGDETARIFIVSPKNGQKIREYRTHIRGVQKLSFNNSPTLLISTGKDDTINVYEVGSPVPKEKVHILGQGANFYGATFSPKLPTEFVTGILGAGARQYNAKSGKVGGFFTGHGNQGVFDVEFNPNGTRIATAGRDSNVMLWDAKTGKAFATLKGHGDWVVDVAFSPNGRLLASSSSDRTVKVWDTITLKKIADIPNESFVGSPLVFTADGKSLVTVNDQGFLQILSVSPPQSAARR